MTSSCLNIRRLQQTSSIRNEMILKKTATLLDPLGFLSPFVVKAKLLMQQTWLQALEWDEVLPPEQKEQWKSWLRKLLEEIKVPRGLKNGSKQVTSVSLHTFTDASQKAYSVALYHRQEYKDWMVTVRLIASNTRLEPVKAINVPRLELMGALIVLRLTKQVGSALDITTDGVTSWVESENVGFWIRRQSREYKPLVAQRVGGIHKQSNPEQWRHVPGHKRPADLCTWRITARELAVSESWWNGPEFLHRPEAKWPIGRFDKPSRKTMKELKSALRPNNEASTAFNVIHQVATENEADAGKTKDNEWRLDPSRYSKWYRANLKREPEFGL